MWVISVYVRSNFLRLLLSVSTTTAEDVDWTCSIKQVRFVQKLEAPGIITLRKAC